MMMTTVEQTLVMTMILMIMKKKMMVMIGMKSYKKQFRVQQHRRLIVTFDFSLNSAIDCSRLHKIVPLQLLQLQPALPLAANQKSGSGGARQDAITTAGGHLCWCAAVASALLLQVSLQVLVSLLTGLQLVVDGKNLMRGSLRQS